MDTVSEKIFDIVSASACRITGDLTSSVSLTSAVASFGLTVQLYLCQSTNNSSLVYSSTIIFPSTFWKRLSKLLITFLSYPRSRPIIVREKGITPAILIFGFVIRYSQKYLSSTVNVSTTSSSFQNPVSIILFDMLFLLKQNAPAVGEAAPLAKRIRVIELYSAELSAYNSTTFLYYTPKGGISQACSSKKALSFCRVAARKFAFVQFSIRLMWNDVSPHRLASSVCVIPVRILYSRSLCAQ